MHSLRAPDRLVLARGKSCCVACCRKPPPRGSLSTFVRSVCAPSDEKAVSRLAHTQPPPTQNSSLRVSVPFGHWQHLLRHHRAHQATNMHPHVGGSRPGHLGQQIVGTQLKYSIKHSSCGAAGIEGQRVGGWWPCQLCSNHCHPSPHYAMADFIVGNSPTTAPQGASGAPPMIMT